MDARVSELFGSGNDSGSQDVASYVLPGNSYGVALKKSCVKMHKKSKSRFARNFKPSNNPPYLPPEVSLQLSPQLASRLAKAITKQSIVILNVIVCMLRHSKT